MFTPRLSPPVAPKLAIVSPRRASAAVLTPPKVGSTLPELRILSVPPARLDEENTVSPFISQIWSSTSQRQSADLFSVQSELAAGIA
jgi:hypothetical protein